MKYGLLAVATATVTIGGTAVHIIRNARTNAEEAARRRHPTSLTASPQVNALRTLRFALEEAWTVIDDALRAPLAERTRKSLNRAATILDTARQVHPAGKDRTDD